MERAVSTADPEHLDLKALRLAVHGWWLGNPLAYKPGAADLSAVARELAAAGAASGTLVLSDAPACGDHDGAGNGPRVDAAATHVSVVHAILILRPPMPSAALGMAAAQSVAEVAQSALGRPCSIRWRWQVILRTDDCESRLLCRISVEEGKDVAFVDLRLALGSLAAAGRDLDQPAPPLFARADWREVFLARVLHALDTRLRAPRAIARRELLLGARSHVDTQQNRGLRLACA